MSGTSLDGLDIACCTFSREDEKWSHVIQASACIAYTPDWKQRLQSAPGLPGPELIALHREYGSYLGMQVDAFVKEHNLTVALVASHGHTILHRPEQSMTFQAGDGACISAVCGLPVVSDFRSMDIAAGGQGAPLVPIGDMLLFGEYELCLNLGGIANISVNEKGRRYAWDISPCNLMLNALSQEAGMDYDEGGKLAATGSIIPELLEKLDDWKYYKLPPPKSLDKDSLLSELLPVINNSDASAADNLATVCLHIAKQVHKAVRETKSSNARILVTGGGAYNTHLISEFRKASGMNFIIPDRDTIDYKEALVFAFLGLLRMLNRPNALAASTGAAYDSIGGALHGDFSEWRGWGTVNENQVL
ncbi:MAG: anhydro-N-acetylmuramic acid kinase [Bacteroidota bacterium]|nr:anhydro-N-acetylmuramic acid kinase [Bacteroidota bacterium]